MSELDKPTPRFHPNPKRQLILVLLALLGLGLGYGLGFVFKRPPPSVTPSAPPQSSSNVQPTPNTAVTEAPATPPEPVPGPVLPEAHDNHSTQVVRAYEEALPKEIVVIMEPLTPKAENTVKAPPTLAPKPSAPPTPKEMASAPVLQPETEPSESGVGKSSPKKNSPEKASPEQTSRGETPPNAATQAWRQNAVAVTLDGRPKIAIVMDDLGIDRGRTRRTLALPGPLSLSFLAYARELQTQADAGRHGGHEIWLHVPMEPSSTSVDPGPNVLLASMPATERTKSLNWNLDQLHGFVGINNHMGSRFTADAEGMHGVMIELKKRGLAFLDSMTTPKSFGHTAARDTGVPFTLRNVFLDHEDSRAAVEAQLLKLEALARKHGHALAIGHPREATLAALAPWLGTLDAKGFQLVPASALLRVPDKKVAKAPGH